MRGFGAVELVPWLRGRTQREPPPPKRVKHGLHYRSHYVASAKPLLEPDLLYRGPERRKGERRGGQGATGGPEERRRVADRRRAPLGPG